jgi:hypothetical protein
LAEARHAAASSRRKPITIALAVVAVLGLGALAFALTGGNDGPLGPLVPGTGEPDRVTPEFDFAVRPARAVPTVQQKAKHHVPEAEKASTEVTVVLDDLYTAAYLDPDNWTNGTYDSMLEAFDAKAAAQAGSDLATLTAGASAGETFDDIQPGRGLVRSDVLMDAKGHAASVAARVTFTARATSLDGTVTLMMSEGEFFFRPVDGGWKVVGFDVKRSDKVVEAPTPSVTTSVTTSASPSGAAS